MDWHYFIKTADQMKLVICFLFTVSKIFKMAAHIRKHRMNRDKTLVEISADQDSDVSDFSESEFKFSVSEESEEEEEENEGEHDESGKEEDENEHKYVCGALQGNCGLQ